LAWELTLEISSPFHSVNWFGYKTPSCQRVMGIVAGLARSAVTGQGVADLMINPPDDQST
jgi:hypothetical protein